MSNCLEPKQVKTSGGKARIADLDHLALTRSLGKRSGSDCGDLNGSHLAFNWSPGSPLPPQVTRAPISQYPNLEPQIATLCAKSATTTVSPSPQGTFDRAVPLSSPFHSFPINPRLPQETTRDLGLRRNNGSNMWRGRQRGAGTLLTGVAADTRWCKVGAGSSVVL